MTNTISTAVQLIYAGGTFGSYGRPLAPLSAEVFLPTLQQLLTEQDNASNLPQISWLDNALIKDSSQFTPIDFVHFYQLLLSAYQQGGRRFLLITGTDTLSYLGAFLAEAFAGSDICVVVTGSMRPLLNSEELHAYKVDAQSDAWSNLTDALKLAAAGESGVKITFGGESWPAQTVQKYIAMTLWHLLVTREQRIQPIAMSKPCQKYVGSIGLMTSKTSALKLQVVLRMLAFMLYTVCPMQLMC